jgi:hypothetical protein
MDNRQKMRKKLDKKVVPFLVEKGFSGKYPDFYRRFSDRVELLTFQTNKWGGSFLIEISTVFLNVAHAETNCFKPLTNGSEIITDAEELNVFWTNQRYRLNGMKDGWFYYNDLTESTNRFSSVLYKLWLTLIKSDRLKTYQPKVKVKTIIKINDDSYELIANEILRQMDDAFMWWESHSTPKLMQSNKN